MPSIAEKVDPQTIWAPPGSTAFAPAFDGLLWMDADGKLQPALAVSWTNVDDKTWEFKLRQGVKFQNGDDFTADDVKATFDRLLDADKVAKLGLIVRGQVPSVSSVEVVDKYTVRLKTSTPDPILPKSLPIVFILPSRYYSQVGDDGFAAKPIGTGPFKIAQFNKGERIVYEAWDGSWRGKPNVDVVNEVQLTEDATRLSALRTGEIDIALNVPADQAPGLAQSGMTIVTGPIAAQELCDVWATEGPLADRRVREALNYAIDKETIVKNIMKGYGAVADGQPFVKQTAGFDPNVKAFPYDPQKAKDLLAQAGYPDGFELRFQHSVGFIPNDVVVAQAIQGMLGDVGVRVSLEPLEYSVFRSWFFRSDRSPLFCWKMLNYPQLDAAALHSIFFYPSPNMTHPLPGGPTSKDPGWVNDKYKALVEEARSTFDDARRAELSQQATEVMLQDLPHLYMVQYSNILATRPNIKGVVPRVDENIFFDSISKQ
jgi:peptide/nickel transport system substrate-binding protein